MTITPEQLERWRALCEAATPGPWEWATSNSFRRLLTAGQDGVLQPTTQRSDGQRDIAGAAADMDFITTARTALPLLLDEVGRLRVEIEAHRRTLAEVPGLVVEQVVKEREACAKLADCWVSDEAAAEIAAAIRKRNWE